MDRAFQRSRSLMLRGTFYSVPPNKWLAEKLGKDPATVSKWCTNSAQPNLENLMEIAKCLEVDVNELLRMK